jgi:undecaprenyl-diphosphatase
MIPVELSWWGVTTLGDYEVLFAVALGYALVVRPGRFLPVALVVAAIGLTTALKTFFGVPRPPGAAVGGWSFPSGHATVSTVCYGTLAVMESRGLDGRILVAGLLAGSIGVSRVVIGVHRPVDVAAGFVLGGMIVAVGLAVRRTVEQHRQATNAVSE